MCSITVQTAGSSAAARLAALSEHSLHVNAEIAGILADPALAADLAAIPAEALAGHATTVLASVDVATASATVLVGQVHATAGRRTGTLIAGTYASTRRWLEVEAGLSATSATAIVARSRDLRGDYARLTRPWLTGAVSGDAVRTITTGITGALRRSPLPATDRGTARGHALDLIVPIAERGTVADVARAVDTLALATDPDGAAQAAMDAYDDQSLTLAQVGSLVRLSAWLTPDAAAALMTVLVAKVATRHRTGDLAREDRPPAGADPDTWDERRQHRDRHSHQLAIALGETMTALLDDDQVGSHHGIAPHLTVTVDLTRFHAGLGGDLTLPGRDHPVLLTTTSIERILCDADLTTLLTRPTPTSTNTDTDTGTDSGRGGSEGTAALADLLLDASREVLYVGRTQRVVTPRLRRALEARDQHCAFPDCRASTRRCNAHHVRTWENGGTTDLDNMASS